MLKPVNNYLLNVTKSIAYAAADVASESAPDLIDFGKDNKAVFVSTYNALKNPKTFIKKQMTALAESKAFKSVDLIIKNSVQDLKTGNFYNKARQNSLGESMAEDWNDLSEFGIDDDWENNLSNNSTSTEITAGDRIIADTIEGTTSASTNATINAVIASADNINKGNRANMAMMYTQNERLFGGLHNDISILNNTVESINKISGESLKNIDKNMSDFFTQELKLSTERNAILKEMLEMQRNQYKSAADKEREGSEANKRKSNKMTWDDLQNNGMINIGNYVEHVKTNLDKEIKNSFIGQAFRDQLGEGTSMIDVFAASPLAIVFNNILKNFVPVMLTDTLSKFNESMTGVFGTAIGMLSNLAKDKGGIFEVINKVLGVSTNVNSRINGTNYEKGSIPFDGITRKAIIDVIPWYLSRIESYISGAPQTIFDYSSGEFKTAKQIKEQYKEINERSIRSGTRDLRNEIEAQMKIDVNRDNSTKEEIESFNKNLDLFLRNIYKNNGVFNENKDKSYNNQDNVDDEKYAYFTSIIKNIGTVNDGVDSEGRMKQKTFYGKRYNSKQVLDAKRSAEREYRSIEESDNAIKQYFALGGDSAFDRHINFVRNRNGDETGEIKLQNNILLRIKDHKNYNIFDYLRLMSTELGWQRLNWAYGGNGGGNKKKKNNINTTLNTQLPPVGSTLPAFNVNHHYTNDRTSAEEEERIHKKRMDLIRASGENNVVDFEKLFSTLDSNDELDKEEEKRAAAIFANRNTNIYNKGIRLAAEDARFANFIYKIIGEDRKTLDAVTQDIKNAEKEKDDDNDKNDDNTETSSDTEKGFLEKVEDFFKKVLKAPGGIAYAASESFQNILLQADRAIYEMFFKYNGSYEEVDEDGTKHTVEYEGFMDMISHKLKNTFDNTVTFIKDKILQPFKDKLNIDSDFGEKFKESLTGQLKVIGKYFFDTAKEITAPLIGPINNAFSGEDYRIQNRSNERQTYVDTINNLGNMDYNRDLLPLLVSYGVDTKKIYDKTTAISAAEKALRQKIYESSNYGKEISNSAQLDYITAFLTEDLASAKNDKERISKLRSLANAHGVELRGDTDAESIINAQQDIGAKMYESAKGRGSINDKFSNRLGTLLSGIEKKIKSGADVDLRKRKDGIIKLINLYNKKNNTNITISDNVVEEILKDIYAGSTADQILEKLKAHALSADFSSNSQSNLFTQGFSDRANDESLRISSRRTANINQRLTQEINNNMNNGMDFNTAENAARAVIDPKNLLHNIGFAKGTIDDKSFISGDFIASAGEGFITKSKDNKLDFGIFNKTDYYNTGIDKVAILSRHKTNALLYGEPYDKHRDHVESSNDEKIENELKFNNRIPGFAEGTTDDARRGIVLDTKTDLSKLKDDVLDSLPKTAATSVIGAVASLILGVAGGPITGALVGGIGSIIKNSEILKEKLFGRIGADGERDNSGLISNKVLNSAKAVLPDMAKYGIFGIIPGLLTPLGPIGGLLVGGTIGFLKNNETFKEKFFGTNGIKVSNEEVDIIKKLLKGAGIGAAIGGGASLIGLGPFGIVGNMLLGAGLGMTTTTNDFRDMLLGIKDANGDYTGGLLDKILDIFKPLSDAFVEIKDKLSLHIDEYVLNPLKKFIKPFIYFVPTLLGGIPRLITKAVDTYLENFGLNLAGLFKSFTTPIFNKVGALASKIVGGLLMPAKWIGNLVGSLGDKMKDYNISKNQLMGESANDIVSEYDAKGKGHLVTKETRLVAAFERGEFDKETGNSLLEALDGITQTKRNLTKDYKQKYSKLNDFMDTKELSSGRKLDESTKKAIRSALSTGKDPSKIAEIVRGNGYSQDEVNELFNQNNFAKMLAETKNANDRASKYKKLTGEDLEKIQDELNKKFPGYEIDLSDTTSMNKLRTMLGDAMDRVDGSGIEIAIDQDTNKQVKSMVEILTEFKEVGIKLYRGEWEGQKVHEQSYEDAITAGYERTKQDAEEIKETFSRATGVTNDDLLNIATTAKGRRDVRKANKRFSGNEAVQLVASRSTSLLGVKEPIIQNMIDNNSIDAFNNNYTEFKRKAIVDVLKNRNVSKTIIESNIPIDENALECIYGNRKEIIEKCNIIQMNKGKREYNIGSFDSLVNMKDGELNARKEGGSYTAETDGRMAAFRQRVTNIKRNIPKTLLNIGEGILKNDTNSNQMMHDTIRGVRNTVSDAALTGSLNVKDIGYAARRINNKGRRAVININGFGRIDRRKLFELLRLNGASEEAVKLLIKHPDAQDRIIDEINNGEKISDIVDTLNQEYKDITSNNDNNTTDTHGFGTMALEALGGLAKSAGSGLLNLGGKAVKGAGGLAVKGLKSAGAGSAKLLAKAMGYDTPEVMDNINRMWGSPTANSNTETNIQSAGSNLDELNKDKSDGKVKVFTNDGDVIQVDDKGPDPTDAATKDYLNKKSLKEKAIEKLQAAQSKASEAMSNIFGDSKESKSKKLGWLTALFGGYMLVKSGVAKKIFDNIIKPVWSDHIKPFITDKVKPWFTDVAMPAISNFIHETVVPALSSVCETLAPLVGSFIGDMLPIVGKTIWGVLKGLVPGLGDELLGNDYANNAGKSSTVDISGKEGESTFTNKNGRTLTYEDIRNGAEFYNVDGTKGYLDENGNPVFDDSSKKGGAALRSLGRATFHAAAQGNAGVGVKLTKGAFNALAKAPGVATTVVGKTGAGIIGGAAKAGSAVGASIAKHDAAFAKAAGAVAAGEKAGGRFAEMAANQAAKKGIATKGVGKIVQTLMTKLNKGVEWLFSNVKVLDKLYNLANKLGQAPAKLVSSLKEKVLTVFGKAAKEGSEKMGKEAAKQAMSKANFLLTAAIVVADFFKGCDQAEAILGVTETSVLEEVIAGLVNALCNLLIIPAIIPGVNAIARLLYGFFDKSLEERQKQAQAEYEAYVAETGSTKTLEEYLKTEYSVTGKIGDKIKQGVGKAWTKTKEVAAVAWDKTKEVAGKAWGGMKELGADLVSSVGGLFKKAIDGDLIGFWTHESSGDGVTGAIANVVTSILKVSITPVTFVSAIIHKVVDFVKPIVLMIKTYGEDMIQSVKGAATAVFHGDLGELWSVLPDVKDEGIVGVMAQVNTAMLKILLTPMTLVSGAIHKIVSCVKPVIEGIKTYGSDMKESITNLASTAFKGDLPGFFSFLPDTKGEGFVGVIAQIHSHMLKCLLSPVALISAGIHTGMEVVKNLINGIKTYGENMKESISEMFTSVIHGDLSGFFGAVPTVKDEGFVGVLSLVNTAVLKILWTPMALVSAGIHKVVSFVSEKIINPLKRISTDSNRDSADMFRMAIKGEVNSVMNHASSTNEEGFVGGVVKVNNFMNKIIYVPIAFTVNVFNKAKKFIAEKIIEPVKQMAANDMQDRAELRELAFAGDISGVVHHETSATEDGFVGGISKVNNFMNKIIYVPIAAVIAGFNAAKQFISERIIEPAKQMVANEMQNKEELKELAFAGDIDGTINHPAAGEGEGFVGAISGVSNFMNKIIFVPVAAIVNVISSIKNKFAELMEKASNATNTEAADAVITRAENGEISVFSSEYWSTSSDDGNSGIFSALNVISGFMKKLINAPIILVQNFIGGFKKKMDAVKDFAIKTGDALKEGLENVGDGIKSALSWVNDALLGGAFGTLSDNLNAKYGRGKYSKQIDPSIAGRSYNAKGDTEKQTIGDSGCGPAAAVNAIESFGRGGNNVLSAADYAISGGYKERNGGTKPGFFMDYFNSNGYNSSMTSNKQKLANNINNGEPTVLMGRDPRGTSSMTPFGKTPHYVTVTGVDGKGNAIVQDPESSTDDQLYPLNDLLNKSSLGVSAYGRGGNFPKYNLNEAQIKGIANIADHEQGSRAGKYAEASLIANRTDISGDDKATVQNMINTVKSGWFKDGKNRFDNPGNPPQVAIDAVRDTIINGKRTVPRYVDEHDCLSDIKSISTGNKKNSSDYKQFETVIKNNMGSTYTFYEKLSAADDPFGYTSSKMREKWGDDHYDISGASVSGPMSGSTSSTSATSVDDTSSSSTTSNDPMSGFAGIINNLLDNHPGMKALNAFMGTTSSSSSSSSSGNSSSNSGGITAAGDAASFIQAAAGEVGYKETGDNKTKYGQWYGMDGQPWCAMFVSWAADKAGIPTSVIPKFSYVPDGYNKLKQIGAKEVSGSNAAPGDILFVYNNKKGRYAHTGLVEAVDNKVHTIEGNSSDMVARRSYEKNKYTYIRPNFATNTANSSSMDSSKLTYEEGDTSYANTRGGNNNKPLSRYGTFRNNMRGHKYGTGFTRHMMRTADGERNYIEYSDTDNLINSELTRKQRFGKGTSNADNKLLNSIISILMTIADNTDKLNLIVSILNEKLGINITADDVANNTINKQTLKDKLSTSLNRANPSSMNKINAYTDQMNDASTNSLITAMQLIASE